MFALRRVCTKPLTYTAARRGNATVQAATEATRTAPTPPPLTPVVEGTPKAAGQAEGEITPKTGGRNVRRRRQRPNISLEKPKEWNRPIAKGVIPAYDEALKVIQEDSKLLIAEAEALRSSIQLAETADVRNDERLEKMRKKLNILEVQSRANLPEVRWKFVNAMGDMSQPVYRHLAEQRWRKDGDLDLLMERIHQMNVVPDVLPDLHPSVDIRITVPSTLKQLREGQKVHAPVEPGAFVFPRQTTKRPNVFTTVFHPETKLYTLLMVDPDVPHVETQSFTTYLHWLQPNISLSATTQSRLLDLNTHTPYIPPHPQRGTPYHRYVLLLLPQSDPTKPLEIPIVADSDRLGFDTRSFLQQWGLDGVKGGGAHMFRQVWDADVSKIYSRVLHTVEPKFGRPPKFDRYADVKKVKKYV
ncbi:hypothetical protein EYR40_004416 [Pleurotus pulmonarius]|nr:hypothetical protein EYR40_004416 [Pleurotus pulmonarius]KAF4607118.1 hypothetical protein EYR38_001176 [Pleurotus pulmonarius]